MWGGGEFFITDYNCDGRYNNDSDDFDDGCGDCYDNEDDDDDENNQVPWKYSLWTGEGCNPLTDWFRKMILTSSFMRVCVCVCVCVCVGGSESESEITLWSKGIDWNFNK